MIEYVRHFEILLVLVAVLIGFVRAKSVDARGDGKSFDFHFRAK